MSISKKIVLLGHYGVGKTSIIRQFVTNEFSSDYKVTIGVHILKKEVLIKDELISLILWDIEGTDHINQISQAYLLGSHAFVFTYDISRPATYKNLLDQIDGLRNAFPNTLFKIIGNKLDLISEVNIDSDAYKSIIEKTDYLTSAKTGENIEPLFNDLALEFSK
ncbi:MAG: GTP-binding protein [Winogradskyella sp.]|uniref:Rab family GTPase n=1 Tax=Winogradskyella sp. TaxID=1883156 RepID=UPI000F3CB490|nr:Rab family GTPase [Winogradskyella sp.]RNC84950.1 MAG: GTP-binding protein [Winogradskyella sp.]